MTRPTSSKTTSNTTSKADVPDLQLYKPYLSQVQRSINAGFSRFDRSNEKLKQQLDRNSAALHRALWKHKNAQHRHTQAVASAILARNKHTMIASNAQITDVTDLKTYLTAMSLLDHKKGGRTFSNHKHTYFETVNIDEIWEKDDETKKDGEDEDEDEDDDEEKRPKMTINVIDTSATSSPAISPGKHQRRWTTASAPSSSHIPYMEESIDRHMSIAARQYQQQEAKMQRAIERRKEMKKLQKSGDVGDPTTDTMNIPTFPQRHTRHVSAMDPPKEEIEESDVDVMSSDDEMGMIGRQDPSVVYGTGYVAIPRTPRRARHHGAWQRARTAPTQKSIHPPLEVVRDKRPVSALTPVSDPGPLFDHVSETLGQSSLLSYDQLHVANLHSETQDVVAAIHVANAVTQAQQHRRARSGLTYTPQEQADQQRLHEERILAYRKRAARKQTASATHTNLHRMKTGRIKEREIKQQPPPQQQQPAQPENTQDDTDTEPPPTSSQPSIYQQLRESRMNRNQQKYIATTQAAASSIDTDLTAMERW